MLDEQVEAAFAANPGVRLNSLQFRADPVACCLEITTLLIPSKNDSPHELS